MPALEDVLINIRTLDGAPTAREKMGSGNNQREEKKAHNTICTIARASTHRNEIV